MTVSPSKPSFPAGTSDDLEAAVQGFCGDPVPERPAARSRYRVLRWCFWLIVSIHTFPIWLMFETLQEAAHERPLRFSAILAVPVSAISVSAVWFAWTNRTSLEKWMRLLLGIGSATLVCAASYRVTFDSNGVALFPFTCVGAWLAARLWRTFRRRELRPPTHDRGKVLWLARWLPAQPVAGKQVGIGYLFLLMTVFALPFAWISTFQSAPIRTDLVAQFFAFWLGLLAGIVAAEMAEVVWAGRAKDAAALFAILLGVLVAAAMSFGGNDLHWVDVGMGFWVLFVGPLASFAALKRGGYELGVRIASGL